jgi:hypothetical protein
MPLKKYITSVSLRARHSLWVFPTAIPYDVVQVGDLYGSVFELLDAKSFAKLLKEGVSTEELAKQSVAILKAMHGTMLKDGELPSKKKDALVWAEFDVDYLPEEIGAKLLKLFNEIPETNNMLHGDFTLKTLCSKTAKICLLIMDTLSMGHPILSLRQSLRHMPALAALTKITAQLSSELQLSSARTFGNTPLNTILKMKTKNG